MAAGGWFAAAESCGPVAARGVPDGPDADLDNLLQIIVGALSVATRRARIVTRPWPERDSMP